MQVKLIKTGFDISDLCIKQWAILKVGNNNIKLTIGDRFVDEYSGILEICGFDLKNNHLEVFHPYKNLIQPIFYLDTYSYLVRKQPIIVGKNNENKKWNNI